ncbi:MAG: methylated-DNA--[protein]-cysteine S-methyltransferase [Polyangiaceae bacterium]
MSVLYTLFDSSLGACGIAWEDDVLIAMNLPQRTRRETEAHLKSIGATKSKTVPKWVERTMRAVAAQIDGRTQNFSRLKLDEARVPPFHRRVYEAAREIPSGQTETYGSLALKMGAPKSQRAVGQALGKNPFAIVVPCHRVLAAGNKPGGFTAFGGWETKKKLLLREGASLSPPRSAKNSKADLDALAALRLADPKLAKIIDRVGAYAIQKQTSKTTFEALARSIVYQQLSGKAAGTIFGRLIDAVSGTLTPEAILAAADNTLRGAGLSRSKTLSIRDLAEKTIAGKIPSIARLLKMDDEKIIETLTEVRGIGRWSVEMLLMFRLGRRDVLPVSDYGIRKGVMLLHGLRDLPSLDEVAKHGEKWQPHRTMASWYLWRSLDISTP